MRLPQCEILSPTMPMQEILFVSGGRPPSVDWFKEVADGRKIFCIDKGIELCKACGVIPSFLIGDFDSANQSAVDWAQAENISVEKHPADKDLTDTQLALNRAAELFGEHTAILTGAFGGRFDHLYSTIFTCAALSKKIFFADEQGTIFYRNTKILLADEREIIFYLQDGEWARIAFFTKPLAVSLLPITNTCEGVTTENLHWELDGATLRQDFPNAVSNRIEEEKIFISMERGTLAVYLCFDE